MDVLWKRVRRLPSVLNDSILRTSIVVVLPQPVLRMCSATVPLRLSLGPEQKLAHGETGRCQRGWRRLTVR
jgi:hypothetical protein